MADIEFRVDAVLGDTTQLQQQIQDLKTNLSLQIDNSQALQAIQQVQTQINALQQSMTNMNFSRLAGLGGGGSNPLGTSVGNVNGVVVEASNNLKMTQGTIDTIKDLVTRVNLEVEGTVSRLRLISDEQGNIVGGTATIVDGYTTYSRTLQQASDSSGNLLANQLEIVNTGSAIVNYQKQQNDAQRQQNDNFREQVSLTKEIETLRTRSHTATPEEQAVLQAEIQRKEVMLGNLQAQNQLTQAQQNEIAEITQKANAERNILDIKKQQIDAQRQQQQANLDWTRGDVKATGISSVSEIADTDWFKSLGKSAQIVGGVTRSIDSMGHQIEKTTVRTKTADNQWERYNVTVDKTAKEMRELKGASNDVNNSQMTLGNMLTSAIKRFAVWGVAMKIWTGVGNSVKECTDYIKDYDEALTNIRVVTMDTKQATESLMKTYNELGQSLGASTTDIAEGAIDWLNKIGLLYRNI